MQSARVELRAMEKACKLEAAGSRSRLLIYRSESKVHGHADEEANHIDAQETEEQRLESFGESPIVIPEAK